MLYIKDDINYVCSFEPSPQTHKSRNEWGWYNNDPEVNGVLQRIELYDIVSAHITNYTKSTQHYCLRSWWVVLNTGDEVPQHIHKYHHFNRVVSGVFYLDGDKAPLHILENGIERLIDNRKNRLLLFDGHHQHWTLPYTGTKTRYAISFDFMISNQPLCDCESTRMCHKCIHMKHTNQGITAYAGPAKTDGVSGSMNRQRHIDIYSGSTKLNEADLHDYKK
jgi:hypothetical protein